MRVVYLHGFASGPASRKARLFIEKLRVEHISVEALDLAPDFRHLTLSSQLKVIDNAVKGDPVMLIGSSLGGYLAALYASKHLPVDRLILLAPAFDFYQLWADELGPGKLAEWRKNRSIPVFHYGMGKHAPLDYQLMEDAQHYPPFPDFAQPCLILHGLKDSVVPYEMSAAFAATHPNVTLVALDSGHEMTDVLDEIWNSASTFLLGPSPKSS
jgi:pimeloyl-ACP methyl ester carboxylesterase